MKCQITFYGKNKKLLPICRLLNEPREWYRLMSPIQHNVITFGLRNCLTIGCNIKDVYVDIFVTKQLRAKLYKLLFGDTLIAFFL